MLVLKDIVEIQTSATQVFEWLSHFDENYRAWHPDHVVCKYLRGASLQVGSILYCEEYLHGRLHRMKFRITSVAAGSRVDYVMAPGMSGSFEIKPTERGAQFIAEICIGTKIPLLGRLLDKILDLLFSTRIEQVRRHMSEEGVNLKHLLEQQSVGSAAPAR